MQPLDPYEPFRIMAYASIFVAIIQSGAFLLGAWWLSKGDYVNVAIEASEEE